VSTVAYIDVDLGHNGKFDAPGSLAQTTVLLQGGVQGGVTSVTLNPLPAGTYQIRARVSDLAGNGGVSPLFTLTINPSGSAPPKPATTTRLPDPVTNPTPPADPNAGFIGSTVVKNLVTGYFIALNSSGTIGPSSHALADFMATQRQYYVFNSSNDLLVRVRTLSQADMKQALIDLNKLGFTLTQLVDSQDMIVGYLPMAALRTMEASPAAGGNGTGITGFASLTPVYSSINNVGAVTTVGDTLINAAANRAATGNDGTGVTVGAISDSVNQIDSHVDSNPDKGIAESQRTGDLPASGVNVLSDGTSSDTDEGRGILEIVHDVAPGASLAFASADPGPQSMANSIVALATQAKAQVIVDDVTFPDEPFFNDGVVAKAVDQVVNQNNVTYVTSAGNFADHAWADKWRGVSTTVGGISGTFENFASTGQNVLQSFSLQKGQTLNLSFQWDSPFLEGGGQGNYKVTNSLYVYVLDSKGSQVLQTFDDNNLNTDEALQRVIFTNNGNSGTNDFTLAFRLVSGSAPTQLKWIRFDNNAAAQYQGAPTIFGQAAASGALTVGAVPASNTNTPESYTSQGKATILFDASGKRLSTPEVRSKPDVAAPDGVHTANFPGLPAGQTLPAGTFPVFNGTSAAAAHAAGAAALLVQANPTATGSAIDQALIQSAKDVGPAGWDVQTGAGLIQLSPAPAVTIPTPSKLQVGPNIDVSKIGAATFRSSSGADLITNSGPKVGSNIDASQHTGNEVEQEIAIDPTHPNRLYLASKTDSTDSGDGLFVSYSTDSGTTWTGRFLADDTDSFTPACCDPSVSWDSFGNLFLTYLNANLDSAVLLLSTDGGVSFQELTTFAAADQPKVTTGANSVWMEFNNGSVQAVGAPVLGLGQVGGFGSVETIPNSDNGNFGNIAIGPNGQVLVSFQDSTTTDGPDAIHVSLNPNGLSGGGFQNPTIATATNVGSFFAVPPQPNRTIDADGRLAWDRSPGPHQGRVYLDYTDSPAVGSVNTNIYVRYSDDNGVTWSPPIKVNDDNSGRSHFWPRLAVDQTNGDVAVSWYDARNDPGFGPGDTDGTPNTDVEFFATLSQNGGRTFYPNVQVAAGPSNVLGQPDFGFDFGDYSGLAFYGGNFYPCWADNSNSTGNNPDGTLNGLDVYTARVIAPPHPLTLGDDRFDPNETSDTATFFGVLTPGTVPYPNLTIDRHANGLFAYDWYRWTAGASGTFTSLVNNVVSTTGDGDLNERVYTLDSQNILIPLGSSRLLGGNNDQSVSVAVDQGEPILVWIYGYNHALASYDLTVTLQ
jgi:hypothetical protein